MAAKHVYRIFITRISVYRISITESFITEYLLQFLYYRIFITGSLLQYLYYRIYITVSLLHNLYYKNFNYKNFYYGIWTRDVCLDGAVRIRHQRCYIGSYTHTTRALVCTITRPRWNIDRWLMNGHLSSAYR